ncbi:hypothetical protein SDC9_140171 [bioreactor metagenome]|uniref:Uncharacterized protein n=1 Tax=bioreactor metagenome TaxID=1076179 RepID=A0A645DUS5_9ZZZZ
MKIRRAAVDGKLALARDISVVFVLRGCSFAALAVFVRFLVSPGGEISGQRVVSAASAGHKVHRNHRKLRSGSSLKEQYLVIFGHVQHIAELALCTLKDGVVDFRSVTHLHYRHTGTFVIGHLFRGALKHGKRQHRGTS